MEYKNLDKHFTIPKNFGKTPHFNFKRVPRKFKKKWKHIFCNKKYDFLDINQKLWYIQHLSNPSYNRFIIKNIAK